MDHRKFAARLAKGEIVHVDELREFWRFEGVTAEERIEILRPLVITDGIVSGAQDAYEEALCELPDDDPRVTEYLDMYGLCEHERRSHAPQVS